MAGISGLNGNLIGGSHRLGSWDLTPDKLQTKEVGGAAVDFRGLVAGYRCKCFARRWPMIKIGREPQPNKQPTAATAQGEKWLKMSKWQT